MKIFPITFIIAIVLSSCATEKRETTTNTDLSQAVKKPDTIQYDLVRSRLTHLIDYPVGAEAFPRSMEPDGGVRGVPSKDWTSGFYPGSLLFLSQLTGDEQYLAKAEQWLPHIEKEQLNDKTHDMGFKVFCSIGNAHRLTKNPKYAEVVVASAKTLITRYNPNVGCIKSWDFGKDKWTFPVIIDNMMNLELLFEATRLTGDSTFHNIADSHAMVTLQNHFRDNNSNFHVVDYNPATGEVVNKLTHQGLNESSSWARGQAWGLYGFTMAYRYTQDTTYLNQAQKIASFILSHPNLPKDMIPYWDFDDPKIPETPRDASAAAVIASALLELSNYTTSENIDYRGQAIAIVRTLSSEAYVLSEEVKVPFILKHSTGNMPKNDEIDVPMGYADYYYLEALTRIGAQL